MKNKGFIRDIFAAVIGAVSLFLILALALVFIQ